MLTDFHMHTNRSDGQLSPEELVLEAHKNGLGIIAITDHDVIDAYTIALSYINKHQIPLKLIPAVEFNTDNPNREVHILGYNIQVDSLKLKIVLEKLRQARSERIFKIIDKLNSLSINITMQDVAVHTIDALSLGRPHVAKALVAKGYYQSIPQAFDEMLARGKPAYIPHVKLSISEAVNIILEMNGIPILAHPGLILDDNHVEELLDKYPLKGLEAFYPKHTPQQVQKYIKFAKKRNLLITGGSDFHGTKGRYPEQLGLFSLSNKQNKDIIALCCGGD